MQPISQKHCRRCLVLKPLTDFHALKARSDGRKSYCKECVKAESAARYANGSERIKAANAAWRDKNPERMDALRLAWAANNRDRLKETSAAWYKAQVAAGRDMSAWRKANPGKHSAIKSTWRKKNRGLVNASTAARFARKLQATPKWADANEIRKFYETAALLTKNTGVRHEVDHIVPLRGKTVSGLHVPANLRVITKVENMKKGNTYWPDMP